MLTPNSVHPRCRWRAAIPCLAEAAPTGDARHTRERPADTERARCRASVSCSLCSRCCSLDQQTGLRGPTTFVTSSWLGQPRHRGSRRRRGVARGECRLVVREFVGVVVEARADVAHRQTSANETRTVVGGIHVAMSTAPFALSANQAFVLKSAFLQLPAGTGPMVNPNGRTLVGRVAKGQELRFVLHGRWSPWPLPTGTLAEVPTFDCQGQPAQTYHGANKWCVAVCIWDPNTSEHTFCSVDVPPGQVVRIVGPFTTNDVWLFMNDDSSGDNSQDLHDPMRFELA